MERLKKILSQIKAYLVKVVKISEKSKNELEGMAALFVIVAITTSTGIELLPSVLLAFAGTLLLLAKISNKKEMLQTIAITSLFFIPIWNILLDKEQKNIMIVISLVLIVLTLLQRKMNEK